MAACCVHIELKFDMCRYYMVYSGITVISCFVFCEPVPIFLIYFVIIFKGFPLINMNMNMNVNV